MKKIISVFIILLHVLVLNAQDIVYNPVAKGKQKNVRVNLSIVPIAEYVKIAGKMDLNISLAGIMTFNDKFFLGGLISKKPLTSYNDYSGVLYDISYQQIGVYAGQNVKLGLYRTKGGHYVKKKTKFIYSIKFGGGAAWMINENGEKASSRDYFYYGTPTLGFTRPVGSFVNIEIGGLYTFVSGIQNKLGVPLSASDFTGPGAYLAVKINFFR